MLLLQMVCVRDKVDIRLSCIQYVRTYPFRGMQNLRICRATVYIIKFCENTIKSLYYFCSDVILRLLSFFPSLFLGKLHFFSQAEPANDWQRVKSEKSLPAEKSGQVWWREKMEPVHVILEPLPNVTCKQKKSHGRSANDCSIFINLGLMTSAVAPSSSVPIQVIDSSIELPTRFVV